MSAKLCVGLQKKVGQPDYGSLGASCHFEIDVEPTLLDNLETFHDRAKRAFVACQQAVHDQLSRNQSEGKNNGAAMNGASSNGTERNGSARSANGYSRQHASNGANAGNRNGHGSANVRPHPPATVSQARAIRAIAKRQEIDLDRLLGERFQVVRPEDLNIADASTLIDDLKAPAHY